MILRRLQNKGVCAMVLFCNLFVLIKTDPHKLLYRGRFRGRCIKNGYYYKTSGSFVVCANRQPSTFHCASGARNSDYRPVNRKKPYRDFCDVNLLDRGGTHQEKRGDRHSRRSAYKQGKESRDGAGAKRLPYFGRYRGDCKRDGYYYRDTRRFVICSHGYAYLQHCAPGTQNSQPRKPPERYHNRSKRRYREFCDVNMVTVANGGIQIYDKKSNRVSDMFLKKLQEKLKRW